MYKNKKYESLGAESILTLSLVEYTSSQYIEFECNNKSILPIKRFGYTILYNCNCPKKLNIGKNYEKINL